MKRLPVFLVAVLAVAAVYFLFFRTSDTGTASQRNTPVVTVLAVYEETISDNVESLGTAQANESITITANVSEVVTKLLFEDGDAVKKGDIIALLSQDEEQAQLAAARAREKENARELRRLKTLLQNRATSQREYDERLTLIEVNKREIEAIQARIADRVLRAPFDGVLGIRRISVGTLVQPGDPITTLDDLSRIKLDFTVPALYLSSLRAGVPIEARATGLDNLTFHGEISSINSRIDPVTRSILVRAILPNDAKHIRPGLLMQVTVLRDQRQALVVAEESILQMQTRHYVLVVGEDGVVEERPIEIGARHPGMVEITAGLHEGEYVIVRGVNTVRAGQTVTIAEEWPRIRHPQTAGAGVQDEPEAESPPVADGES